MNRQEALQWCVENVKDWPHDELPQAFNDSWSWGGLIGSIKLYSLHRNEVSIAKQDWLEAKTNKDELKMNKDLMMKAAIKYKGKWSEDSYDLIVATPSDITLGKRERDGSVTYVSKGVDENTFIRSWSHCTREQFESFVESLFEGAPEDATHRGKDNLFYRINDNSAHFWNSSDKWARDVNGKEWLSNNLIPRPAKKAEPQATYMPKVGEECEAMWGMTEVWGVVTYIGDFMFYEIHRDKYLKLKLSQLENLRFRPLRTERELFIEQATKDYLDQVGSDAVNAKWFERIFGALYDAGYKKTRD